MRSSAPFTLWRPGTDAAGLSASLFDGDIVVFRRLPAVQRLAERAQAILRGVFGSDDPGRTRFGIDSRTVWEPDRRAGRRAPDVDGSPGTEMWAWFEMPEAAGAGE